MVVMMIAIPVHPRHIGPVAAIIDGVVVAGRSGLTDATGQCNDGKANGSGKAKQVSSHLASPLLHPGDTSSPTATTVNNTNSFYQPSITRHNQTFEIAREQTGAAHPLPGSLGALFAR
jgi:hypothetical protein